MKYLIIIIFLIVTPFTSYSAPKHSPLNEYKGGPRYEQKQHIKDKDINDPQMCKLQLKTQSSTEINLMILDYHLSEFNSLNSLSYCQWVSL